MRGAPGSRRSIGACLSADGASGLWLRDTDTTSQPSLAKSRAVARPMPRDAPEISATGEAIDRRFGARSGLVVCNSRALGCRHRHFNSADLLWRVVLGRRCKTHCHVDVH